MHRFSGARVKDRNERRRPVLITGGAGFLGTNLAHRLLSAGRRVVIFDNFTRPGVKQNLRALRSAHGDETRVICGDVRDTPAIERAAVSASCVFHLAAQPLPDGTDPVAQFETNARGTLNLLEAIRNAPAPPPLIHASSSLVYGPLAEIPLREVGDRYVPEDPVLAESGISEAHALDFLGPTGCSKGAADQYVLDYARSYGLAAVVLRFSSIYGPFQVSAPGRGWVAECLWRAILREPITVYGDGRQVRDLLHADDAVEALLLAQEHAATLAGRAFNIGGGPSRTLSPRELVALAGELAGATLRMRHEPVRPGDRRYYVSDTSLFSALTGWQPEVPLREGIGAFYAWIRETRGAALDSERAALLAIAGSDARG
jgi:CDP-paratose 2-epimerase